MAVPVGRKVAITLTKVRDWLEFTDAAWLPQEACTGPDSDMQNGKYEYRTNMRRLGGPSDVNEKVFRDTIIFSGV